MFVVRLRRAQNWFQNRRAKTKQDAKKQQGALHLNLYQQNGVGSRNFGSDYDTSPGYSSGDYLAFMQQFADNDRLSNPYGTGVGQPPMPQAQQSVQGLPYSSAGQSYSDGSMSQQSTQDMFDSPQEMNRRTLTQEQFDAFGLSHSDGHFANFQSTESCDADLQQVFPEMHQDDFKTQHAYAFPHPMSAPISSNDSSIPSSISEQSTFPSSAIMQHHQNLSTESLDWADSRSSSLSMPSSHEDAFHQMHRTSQQDLASQWQPGQSIPVDPNALQQQFSEVDFQKMQSQQQQLQPDNPMTWPVDENFIRRDSQTGSLLAQQMSSFAIQTPQASQPATFKCPPPPLVTAGGIAARRQRPRPATLGIAAMRSQSYSGAAQPASPSHQTNNLAPAQPQLRRIRSSIGTGRVMKSGPGSAQRSPMNFSFADAMNSPRLARQVSSASLDHLAPPTPLSPSEMSHADSTRPPLTSWQSASGPISRQASISETDLEHNISTLPQSFTSPPHTPMYHQLQHQQHQFHSRIGNNVITENTPPQSAPASQQTFPHNTFTAMQHHPQSMAPPQQPLQMQAFTPPRNQPFNEQQVPMSATAFVPPQHPEVAPNDTSSVAAMRFANGVPLVDDLGTMGMGFPPQMQQQQLQFVNHGPPPNQYQSPPRKITAPPEGGQYSFVTSDGTSPGMRVTSQAQKQPAQTAELFVHEYTPPQDVRGVPSSRKPPVDNAPKSYTFANHGPEHFLEKEKAKKSVSSGSPTSASG